MNRKEIETYRRRLSAWRNRVAGDVQDLERETHGDAPDDRLEYSRPEETTTETAACCTGLGLLDNEQHLLAEIDAALARIKAGEFGRCAACGQALGKQRLQAIPYTRFCVPCGERREQESPE